MEGGRREAAERLGDLLGRYAASLLGRFAAQKICEDRTRGDGGHASLRFEADLGDATRLEAYGEAQHIATDRIRDFNRRGGIGEISGIMGIAEVLKQCVAEHECEYTSSGPNCPNGIPTPRSLAASAQAFTFLVKSH
jgi:hypothetical protein